ncbi:PilZ domain-containing protein [Altererythrobacter arenosus]|uniref:PilZ domain-containing protein n=1 Tax=Altererythrobacter arenosus TaxID=3032592 RepID=A0ABY8FUW0_9SPHN|nr:PilZ domain-containing protein [Altererythrobacter sp. CAU 1644]WFL78532.1 PilZ domain-containing protein [Altererythrobacter sp. CAU 1644]
MDYAAARPNSASDDPDVAEERGSPRFTLLIRAAKLVCTKGEFICVIRDVSATGVSLRLFHDLPDCEHVSLELQSGQTYEMRRVWSRTREAGFEFEFAVDVDKLVAEVGQYPKRPVRLMIEFPITISAGLTRQLATIRNVSQQGARIECDALFAIDQSVRIGGDALPEVRAKVRWRKLREYGVVFDDTFSLADLARLAAHLQYPSLLSEKPAARA